jgi:hypothetical protein
MPVRVNNWPAFIALSSLIFIIILSEYAVAEVNLSNGHYHRHIALTSREEWHDFELDLVYYPSTEKTGAIGSGWGLMAERHFQAAPDGVARIISYCEREEGILVPPVFDRNASEPLIKKLVDLASKDPELIKDAYRDHLVADPGFRFNEWSSNLAFIRPL